MVQRKKCHSEEPGCKFSFGSMAQEAIKAALNTHSGHFYHHPKGSQRMEARFQHGWTRKPAIKSPEDTAIKCPREPGC